MSPRIQKKITTDRLIMDSFKELALSTPIEKITINEIVEKAGVIRPTFYNHFQDKYDLLRAIIEEELIEPAYTLFKNGLFYEGLTVIFANAMKSKAFYVQASKLDGVESFENIITTLVRDMILDYIIKQVGESAVVQKWFNTSDVAEYYARSMCFVAIKWVKGGMKIPPSEVTNVYKIVINNSLGDMLHEFKIDDESLDGRRYITLQ